MKRLLAYLFIVLGLGFFINSHALALTKGICIINSGAQDLTVRPNKKDRECLKSQLISTKEYPARYKQLKKIFKEAECCTVGGGKYIKKRVIKPIVKGTHLYDKFFPAQTEKKETKWITKKKEPSQTQKVKSNIGAAGAIYAKLYNPKKSQIISNNCKATIMKYGLDFIVHDGTSQTEVYLKFYPNTFGFMTITTPSGKITSSKITRDRFDSNCKTTVTTKDGETFNIMPLFDEGRVMLSTSSLFKTAETKPKKEETQIAKVEPSQTQQINIVNTGYILDNFIFVLFLDKEKCKINLKGFDSIIRNINYEGSWEQFPCKYKEYKNSNGIFELTGIFPKQQKWGTKNYLLAFNGNKVVVTDAKLGVKYINQVLNGKRQSLYKGVKKELTLSQIAKLPKITKSQIAKAEPSQTQEVDQLQNNLMKLDTWVYFVDINDVGYSADYYVNLAKFDSSHFINNKVNMNNYKFSDKEKIFIYKRKIQGLGGYRKYIRISEKMKNKFCTGTYCNELKLKITKYKPKILKELIDEYTEDNELKEGLLAYFNQEKPTIKPKKKVKVAKVEEPKQEEFKPKKTNKDNEAPVITIAEAITVNDTDYEFQGKVTDQAKTIYVEVDGRPTDVKNGKFIVKGYSPIDKQISIEAIDQWGNRSEPKIVKLTIDIKDSSIAEKLEPLNPSKIRTKSSNNKVALIIGIENYLESPNAKYANLDAKYFFDYARKGFGVKKQNINLLVDEQATFVKTNKALTKWLRSKIKSGQSDLIIFFAGHGLASSDGKELYLLPQDSDPDLLARTALSRTELFQEIINLNPKSVTMFLDTCYSGVSRDEQMLLASARPIRIVADEQSEIPNNFTIFSASKLDQISSGLKEANHGIFSYYLMKGLEGKADANKDKDITNGELLAYMDQNVAQKASELGRQQNPSLAGDPDKILMSYR
jgi:hypothetical protein